jgi:integrase
VDLDGGTILVRKPKEKKTRRVPISAPLVSLLTTLPSRFTKGPVFLDETGAPVEPDRAYRRFKEAAIRAKVPNAERLRLHDLRHAFGTSLAETGAGARDIMALMGHSSLAMTERYVHARDSRLRDAVARLTGIGTAYNPVSAPVAATEKQA